MAWIVVVTLIVLGGVVADLAIGGRPDPPTLRAAATLLDGAWRFHTGDDPHWADANTDDSGWETVDMTALPGSHDDDVGLPDYVAGWMAHGHPGYRGYAWYRRAVTVPAGRATWDILGPTAVDHGFELYWNGQRLGGSSSGAGSSSGLDRALESNERRLIAMKTVYRERYELLTAALVRRFEPRLELLPSHRGLHVVAKPGGRS